MVFYVRQHKASHKFERQLPVKVYWAMLRSSVSLTLSCGAMLTVSLLNQK